MAGRPTKFTPQNRSRILRAIRLGMPAQMAPQICGVSYSIFREWIQKGERGEGGKGGTAEEFAQFAEDVRRAEAEFVESQLEIIEEAAASGTWQAAAWKLERRFAKLFGRKWIRVEADDEEEETTPEDAEEKIGRGVELLRRYGKLTGPERGKGNGSNGHAKNA